ncbi:hypothetical protein [Trueperella sp. LYQ143]|uniref:hypothetical protein n=1 Tax=Trueperella sp. LYQ143 TaxID=3391059 RepID=UPI0039832CE3
MRREPVAQCIKEAGYDVRLSPDGHGFAYTHQPPDLSTQMWTCLAQYTPKEVLYPTGADQESVIYDYYTTFFVPCAEAQGVVFSGEIPSKQAWLASLHGDSGTPWHPVTPGSTWSTESQHEFDDAKLTALYKACPSSPPASALYGE